MSRMGAQPPGKGAHFIAGVAPGLAFHHPARDERHDEVDTSEQLFLQLGGNAPGVQCVDRPRLQSNGESSGRARTTFRKQASDALDLVGRRSRIAPGQGSPIPSAARGKD
jgi:hypothetical protein